jgi:hypothetical protein
MDDQERIQLEQMLETLDAGTSKFETLVETNSRPKLLDELKKLKESELRRIVLARVLLEQERRGVPRPPEAS